MKSNKDQLEETRKEIDDEMIFDMKFSIENLTDKSLIIPHIKHKWVSRKMKAKMRILLLQEEREQLVDFRKREISKSLKIDITEAELHKIKVNNDKRIKEIDIELIEARWTEEYLKDLCSIMTYTLTRDVTNMIEMQKLETQ